MFELYTHQSKVIEELREGFRQGHKRQVLGLATGGGKTVCAACIAKSAVERGKRVLFVVDRIELVGQAVRTFDQIGLRVGILRGEDTDYSREDDIIVASIQTIRSRAAPDWIDLVIIDECHLLHKAHIDLMERWNALPFIGLSATPLRKGLAKHFSNLVRGPSIRELTEGGFLVPVRAFAPQADAIAETLKAVKCKTGPGGFDYAESELGEAMNSKTLVGDIVRTWQDKGENRPTLAFATNIAHSKSIAEDFEAAGVAIQHLDAYTDSKARRAMIERFRSGETKILTSVNVLGIGFDVPDASCLILARPTLSEALHIQQMGRGIRTAPGKRDCIVLDHSGNTLTHGLPEHFEVPDLDDGTKPDPAKAKRKEALKFVACTECGGVMEPAQITCPHCGIDRPRRGHGVEYRDGRLVEFGAGTDGTAVFSVEDRRAWYQAFRWYAERRGWRDGWAFHAFLAKFSAKPPYAWKLFPGIEPTDEQARWIRHYQIKSAKRRAA